MHTMHIYSCMFCVCVCVYVVCVCVCRSKLYQVELLSNTAGDALACLVYNKATIILKYY